MIPPDMKVPLSGLQHTLCLRWHMNYNRWDGYLFVFLNLKVADASTSVWSSSLVNLLLKKEMQGKKKETSRIESQSYRVGQCERIY